MRRTNERTSVAKREEKRDRERAFSELHFFLCAAVVARSVVESAVVFASGQSLMGVNERMHGRTRGEREKNVVKVEKSPSISQ